MPGLTSHIKTRTSADTPGVARRGQGSSGDVPPFSNTGALLQANASIDWLEFTVKTEAVVDRDYYWRFFANLFHGASPLDRGMHGYDRVFSVLGSGFVMFHSDRLQMGFHVTLPAKALAIWSELNPEVSLYKLLIIARNEHATFTRIDICFDTPDVAIDRVIRAVEEGELVTPAQQVLLMRSMRGDPGATVYIGSPSSDRRVRIYDKAAEQGVDGTWTRFETQYRKKYAGQVVDYILMSDVSMEQLAVSSIDFRDGQATRTNNKERSSWWAELLQVFEKVEFSIKKVVTTLEEKAEWFKSSIAPTMSLLIMRFGLDWFDSVFEDGVLRIKDYQKQLLYT